MWDSVNPLRLTLDHFANSKKTPTKSMLNNVCWITVIIYLNAGCCFFCTRLCFVFDVVDLCAARCALRSNRRRIPVIVGKHNNCYWFFLLLLTNVVLNSKPMLRMIRYHCRAVLHLHQTKRRSFSNSHLLLDWEFIVPCAVYAVFGVWFSTSSIRYLYSIDRSIAIDRSVFGFGAYIPFTFTSNTFARTRQTT